MPRPSIHFRTVIRVQATVVQEGRVPTMLIVLTNKVNAIVDSCSEEARAARTTRRAFLNVMLAYP